MLFNLHTEAHDSLHGYVVPYSFSGLARVSVSVNGRVVYRGACDQVIQDLVNIGRHETGQVGFILDDAKVPGLLAHRDLEIHDDDTGFLIYRRNLPDQHVQRRVFRLETALAAPVPYHDTLLPHFAHGVCDAQLYGVETLDQLFHLQHYPSMYFEGRVQIKAHQRFLEAPLFSIVSVTEPFLALALTIEGLLAEDPDLLGQFEEREYAALLPLLACLDGVDPTRPGAIRRRLKSAPKQVMTALQSPLVGRLTGTTPGVGGARGDIPAALDILSQFDVTIDTHGAAHIHADLARMLGLGPGALPPAPIPASAQALADRLRDLPGLQTALENDLIVYHCLTQATATLPAL